MSNNQNKKNILFMLSGRKYSGKDTFAEYLIKQHGFKRIAFADQLKKQVSDTYNVPLHYFHKPEFKEMELPEYPVIDSDENTNYLLKKFAPKRLKHWTPRHLVILEGAAKRTVNPNYWKQDVVNKILQDYKNNGENGNYVISDWRYPDEADYVKQMLKDKFDFVLIRIVRNKSNCKENKHQDITETALDDYTFFDHYISNNSNLNDFYQNIEKLFN